MAFIKLKENGKYTNLIDMGGGRSYNVVGVAKVFIWRVLEDCL